MNSFLGYHFLRLDPPSDPLANETRRRVLDEAVEYVNHSLPAECDLSVFNALLIRARKHQRRLFTVLAAWRLTGDDHYRAHAFECLLELDHWPQWCTAALAADNRDSLGFFELSYGENSLTLAVGFDLLQPTLSREEIHQLAGIARRRAIRPFLERTRADRRHFWFGNCESNWNSVCCGGLGTLALVMEPHVSGCRRALRLVEASLAPLVAHLQQLDGGWPEGVGYWNYGMRYLFYYLLSWETAGRGAHPALNIPAVKNTLRFPLYFCPGGESAGFGDVNQWTPQPFHLAAAEKLNDEFVQSALLARFANGVKHDSWAEEAEFLLFYRKLARPLRSVRKTGLLVRRFRGLDWMVLADAERQARIHACIRGGEAPLSHDHLDLLSVNVVINGKLALENIPLTEYQANTFGHRRWEIHEVTAPYKNTLLINGLGPFCPAPDNFEKVACAQTAAFPAPQKEAVSSRIVSEPGFTRTHVETRDFKGRGGAGYALDATLGYGYDPKKAFVGRCVWLTCDGELFIVDRALRRDGPGRVEARWHTRLSVERKRSRAILRDPSGASYLSFASSVRATLQACHLPCQDPAVRFTTLRWVTDGRAVEDVWLCALIAADDRSDGLSCQATSGGLELSWRRDGASRRLGVSSALEVLE